jgi:hypothetical protein
MEGMIRDQMPLRFVTRRPVSDLTSRNFAVAFFRLVFLFSLAVGLLLSFLIRLGAWLNQRQYATSWTYQTKWL